MMTFNRHIGSLALGLLLSMAMMQSAFAAFPSKYHPGHYMRLDLVSYDNAKLIYDRIKYEPQFVGVQVRIPWKVLEPRRGVYDFSAVVAQLNYLKSMPTPKRLIIELLDDWTDRYGVPNAPDYLRTAEFEYGVYKSSIGKVVARSWNYNVQSREIALFKALGARFNAEPYFEGMILDETATGIRTWEWSRANYTAEKAYAGQKRIMSGLKAAFPNTLCIQYINWYSGASGADELTKLRGLFNHALQIGMGIGAPDVDVQVPHYTYPWYSAYAGSMPLVNSVEWDDWDKINPATGRKVTAAEIFNFARYKLHLNYIPWSNREPYFTNQVIPLVRRVGAP
ncbi:MAG: hypothetical protein ABIR48_04155 [Gammaproteobacteria bacterium]